MILVDTSVWIELLSEAAPDFAKWNRSSLDFVDVPSGGARESCKDTRIGLLMQVV